MNYLDANIFLYPILYSDKKANFCRDILLEVVKGKVAAATSILTWDEIVFTLKKLLGKEIAVNEGRKFLQMPNLSFIKVDEQIILNAQKLIEIYNLNPRDAIHAASALMNNCKEFVSDDSDFDKIKELRRVKFS
ncbi:MAG TPA: type II toxin-antitoxin system VapC family toxin [Candidatus Nanoarchaeia archaeon]|nr:type II toxin-antitoxin system VapC family toxin [Candidatus Nanoarchaeia archaeon]